MCDECRAANTEAARDRRARKKEERDLIGEPDYDALWESTLAEEMNRRPPTILRVSRDLPALSLLP